MMIPRGGPRTLQCVTSSEIVANRWSRDETFTLVGPDPAGGITTVGRYYGALVGNGEVVTGVRVLAPTATRLWVSRNFGPRIGTVWINGELATVTSAVADATVLQRGATLPVWQYELSHTNIGLDFRTIKIV